MGRVEIEDPVSGKLTYRRLLAGANVLGRKLSALAPVGGAVGVMLPNANGAAVTILGLISAGRVPAMINFTAGLGNILSACTAAEVKTIVTSRAFVEKANLVTLVGRARGEGRRSSASRISAPASTLLDRLRGLLFATRPLAARAPDDPAAILFTSGSEGVPKGVVLSHRNILANAAQGAARIDFGRTDKVFNVLPLFHSFGFTVGLVLPLVFGVGIYLYPSPLHYRLVPELVYGSNATILFGTDTFLAGYARTANAYDFRSLRYVLAGAEPVKESTRRVYMEKFGLRILEGYGVTEAAPGACHQHADVPQARHGRPSPPRHRGAARAGARPGGRPAPLRPRTEHHARLSPRRATRNHRAAGRRLARHRRYRHDRRGEFRRHQGSLEALRQDRRRDGLARRGRGARRRALAGRTSSAVTAIPDPRKGERLVLVTDNADATRAAFQAHAKARGRDRADDPRRGAPSSTPCRFSAPARSTTSPWPSSSASGLSPPREDFAAHTPSGDHHHNFVNVVHSF